MEGNGISPEFPLGLRPLEEGALWGLDSTEWRVMGFVNPHLMIR